MPVQNPSTDIQSRLKEQRLFAPPSEFSSKAHIKSLADYERLYEEADRDPETFWGNIARELDWFEPWTKVLEWDAPWAKWFSGGKLNSRYNCLDRHLTTWRRNKAAIIWEGEPGDIRTLTYQQLHSEVSPVRQRAEEARRAEGRSRRHLHGDDAGTRHRSARLRPHRRSAHRDLRRLFFPGAGGPHQRLAGSCVITQDGSFRRGEEVKLKPAVDEALKQCPSVNSVVVYKRTGTPQQMEPGRDHWWHELMAIASDECPAEPLDSEHPLYLLYTSGTTGKPKGILHTTGGYAVSTYITTKWVFDIRDEDIYWCTADIGWVTGHSYVVYGPLQNGATVLMYEGGPTHPQPDRFWDMIDRHKVTIFYTAPTAIRAFMRLGERWPAKHSLKSLRLLGSVGEPINPEAWMWYRSMIGHDRCPIVDTWWQTETGAIMISPIPGATPTKPGSCTRPLPGIKVEVVTREGEPVPAGSGGYLVIRKPWPSMLRTIYGDDERFKQQYWSQNPGFVFHRRRRAAG